MAYNGNWELIPSTEHFQEMTSQWDSLNLQKGNHVLLDSRFVGALVRHFATSNVFLAIKNDPQAQAMALIYRQKPGFWEVFTPSQSPLGPILLAASDPGGQQLRELMNVLPGYPMQLAILRQDPEYSAWLPCGEDSRLEFLECMKTARVRLEHTFENYWRQRSSNLRHNLSRQRRRLKEQGRHLELVAHRSEETIKSCIREFGRLESSGWKAGAGTAVSESNIQGRFYRDMFEKFCGSGETVIFQLLLDGKVAATDLCLLREGMLVVLKTAYDEGLHPFSPALLMREEIIRQLYAEGHVRVIEFYGSVQDWHTKWTTEFRPMYHVNCHRNSLVSGIRDLVRSIR